MPKQAKNDDVDSDDRNDDVESDEENDEKTTTLEATKNDVESDETTTTLKATKKNGFLCFRRHRIFVDFDVVVFFDFDVIAFILLDFVVLIFSSLSMSFFFLRRCQKSFIFSFRCRRFMVVVFLRFRRRFLRHFFAVRRLDAQGCHAPAPVSCSELLIFQLLPRSFSFCPDNSQSYPDVCLIREVCPDGISSRSATFCRLAPLGVMSGVGGAGFTIALPVNGLLWNII